MEQGRRLSSLDSGLILLERVEQEIAEASGPHGGGCVRSGLLIITRGVKFHCGRGGLRRKAGWGDRVLDSPPPRSGQ